MHSVGIKRREGPWWKPTQPEIPEKNQNSVILVRHCKHTKVTNNIRWVEIKDLQVDHRQVVDDGPASAQATVLAEAADGSRLEIGMVQTSLLLQWPWDSQAKKSL